MKSINNHIYWTAAGSTSGPERIAKWTSILNHVRDVHVHEDPLYPKCEHAIRQTSDRSKWLQDGISPIYRLNVKTVNIQLQLFSGFQKFTRGHGCSIPYCMGNGFLISYFLIVCSNSNFLQVGEVADQQKGAEGCCKTEPPPPNFIFGGFPCGYSSFCPQKCCLSLYWKAVQVKKSLLNTFWNCSLKYL